jgi:uncharacterized LabA/DUF88 family protein
MNIGRETKALRLIEEAIEKSTSSEQKQILADAADILLYRRNVAMFVDVPNLYWAVLRNGKRMKYEKLQDVVLDGKRSIASYAFVLQREGADQRSFIDALRHIGFDVKSKVVRDNSLSRKGQFYVDLSSLAMYEGSRDEVHTIAIVSGDGEYVPLVRTLKKMYGVWVEVYAYSEYASPALIREADDFIGLEEFDLLEGVGSDEKEKVDEKV